MGSPDAHSSPRPWDVVRPQSIDDRVGSMISDLRGARLGLNYFNTNGWLIPLSTYPGEGDHASASPTENYLPRPSRSRGCDLLAATHTPRAITSCFSRTRKDLGSLYFAMPKSEYSHPAYGLRGVDKKNTMILWISSYGKETVAQCPVRK